jgi:phosphate-selective porin OprO/OprP
LNTGLYVEDLESGRDISSQGYGLTGRIYFNPAYKKGKLFHLGTSLSARDISETDGFFFRRRPESGLTDVRYVDTGDIKNTENVFRYNIEAAVTAGPVSIQGEYIGAKVTRDSGYDSLNFDGWYVFISWFPTGTTRNYFHREGVFGYPEVKSKNGELEFAVRYSMLDLSDRDIRGGEERNISLGINWYLSRQTRLMANYIIVDNDLFADADGTLKGNDDPRILQFRFQYRI